MRIAVMTDAHANLPALEAALADIRRQGCDLVVHTGDAIAIGPFPGECLGLLLGTPNVQCTMGNHERWFVHGLPRPRPAWLSDGEVQHQVWTHAQLDAGLRATLAGWPYVLEQESAGVVVRYQHYALGPSGDDFAPVTRPAAPEEWERLFGPAAATLVFYGHDHAASDVRGRERYVNPGSLGCCERAVARYCVVDLDAGGYTLSQCAVPYDDAPLRAAFERRGVPEREFICRTFFGGRFR